MREYIGNHSEGDRLVVKEQLNASNLLMGGVLKRCVHGYPEIILLLPEEHCSVSTRDREEGKYLYRSYSNFLWLTCPHLNDAIHDIESKRTINSISDFIQGDKKLSSLMSRAQASYYFYRKRICQQYADMCGQPEDAVCMNNTGIGGIRNTEFLKCLHHHYAHYYLCRSNIAGRITDGMVSENRYCRDVRCQNYG